MPVSPVWTYARFLVGATRLAAETVFAQTDGGLQIFIPRKDGEGNETDEHVIYDRAYYELALEVLSRCFFFCSSQSKRFYKTFKADDNEGNTEIDIESSSHPIHAGQIFAEMLASVSHPEFTSLDQEVMQHSKSLYNDRLLSYSTVTPAFNYSTASFPAITLYISVNMATLRLP